MRGKLCLVGAFLTGPHNVGSVRTVTSPVQKAVQLLEDMLVKSKKEKHEEAVQFARYEKWCEGVTAEKQGDIKKADELIEGLTADIQKFEADVARIAKEIEQHHKDVDGWEKDQKAAKEVRDSEHKEYMKTHADYTESVNALSQAILVLKQRADDTPGSAALLQHAKTLIPVSAQRLIEAYLQKGEDDILSAPSANAYEFQSNDIVSMLEGLKDKFREKKRELEKEETGRRHTWETLNQDLTQSIQGAETELSDDTQTVASRKQKITESQELLDDTTATRNEDQKYLDDTSATCKLKSEDFQARQKLRGEEIEALDKATEILSGDEVSGNAEKHLSALIQQHQKRTTLVQIRGSASHMPDAQLRAAAFLKDQADVIGSRVLSTIALRARDDPFGKVKQLISQLIERLLHEAGEEAEHKGWCDTELGTNENTRKSKTAEVEKLTAEIEGLESKIETLTKDVVDLSKGVAQINTAVAEQTDIRSNETAENQQTIVDAQDGQAAIEKAVKVLKDFYAKAKGAKALIQQREDPPEIFDEPYRGQQSANGGVLAMLDIIKSDFARLEEDTKSAEAAAQSEYDDFMNDSAVDKAAKEKSIEHKGRDKHEAEMALDETKTALESAQEQLTAAVAYYEKLKPSCIDTGMSYEERVKRRRDEIEALKEALRILNGEDLVALNQE